MGDLTAHGGAVVQGSSNVLVDGRPAARLWDMTVCPMTQPAPHVGGPIITGSAMVLIDGQPAARQLDATVCAAGGPAVIVTGSGSVLVE